MDAASWFAQKRLLQAAANAAAVAAALETYRGGSAAVAQAAAAVDAARNGYDAAAGDVMRVNLPPATGRFAGLPGAAEVVITRSAPVYFARALTDAPAIISARAVAVADSEAANTCVWVLDPDDRAAVKLSGGAQVALDCGVIVNSGDAEALTQGGTGSCITASRIRIAGGYAGDCVSPTPQTGIHPVDDPLASLPPPAHGGCDRRSKTKVNSGQRVTIGPGVYCGAIEVSADGELILLPGVYVLDGAGFRVSGQGRVSGTGVFFYVTRNSGASADISFAAGAIVTLSAPTTGTYAGILFYADRAAPANVTHSFSGGSSMQLDGALYFPNQTVHFSGGASLAQTSSILVARTVAFTGHSHVSIAADAAARANRLMIRARLAD